MSTSPMTTVDRLRQAIAETLSIDAQGLQAAIGQLVVATSADYPAAGPQERSLHSSAVRTTVLLADRIPAGQEAQALAQEIALHHGQEAAQAVLGERAAELLGGGGKVENPQERYRLSAMDEGNDHYSVLDTKTQLYWSSEGWQRPDSGWASVLTRSEAARKAYELNRKLESAIDLDDVGEWVGLHYGRNFDAEPDAKRQEWIERYAEAHDLPVPQGSVSNYTAGQNHEPLEHEMAEYVELEVTLRSKTTFGTDKETIRVWDGQSAKDVAERTAQGYGAEVVEIRNPDGSIYEEALKVEVSPSPGM